MITSNDMNQIINKDCLEGLKELPSGIVNTIVTSPPYFGLRNYGVDGQLGLEPTPDEFVKALVGVLEEAKRVLRDDGTLWLNLGDSYGALSGDTHSDFNKRYNGTGGEGSKQNDTHAGLKNHKIKTGVRPKNLIGIPWKVAFALQSAGWYLRQDIIWHKPNPMPESVTDRCTKAHEYIFLLSKSPKYYYDNKAIEEPITDSTAIRLLQNIENQKGSDRVPGKTNGAMKAVGKKFTKEMAGGGTSYVGHSGYKKSDGTLMIKPTRNRRSVWTVTTKPFKGAHFATFPPDLIEPCVLAGCPEGGVVLDPFMGAGTTALVAKRNNRNYIGFELNPEYIKIAEKRLHDFLK